MKEDILLHGIVLSAFPLREKDLRLLFLSMERGKLTIWASGARKPSSSNLAACRTFSFGEFSVKEAKSGYNLKSTEIYDYFEDISKDLENACYASYFMELASTVSEENMEAKELVNLIYVSLKALLNGNINKKLIRRIYELRVLKICGEYSEEPILPCSEACTYAWQYVISEELERLYTFILDNDTEKEFDENVDKLFKELMPYRFKSLQVLESIVK